MHEFISGQCWISSTELQLGLGTVITSDQRTVTITFPATGDTRTYARQSAPLTRVMFAAGDIVQSRDGWSLRITEVREQRGLLTYAGIKDDGSRGELIEGDLNSQMQLNRPSDRLFSGQIDPDKWFELRYRTLQHLKRLAHSDQRGLTGGRTSLIPHQLYIAHEVAQRYAPRVLLADEVGLGKTIEAGMILHQQLLTERAQRVLIVVPENLLHQWLLEMLRRFNLHFSVFDEERCLAADQDGDGPPDNPFLTEQLVICQSGFLAAHPDRFNQALACDWDLLVVDEAHHLQWSPQQASVEYAQIEQLAQKTKGVLLLTATPEQLGKAGHFARLRLLDPQRFSDYAAFIAEEESYEPVARAVEALLNGQPLDADVGITLRNTLAEGDNQNLLDILSRPDSDAQAQADARLQLVEHLLDRHGTGRVLFRNTRAAIRGFPQRRLHTYPLPLPAAYAESQVAFQAQGVAEATGARLLLCPELLHQSGTRRKTGHWTQIDPRIDWLIGHLKALRPEKVLVITASADSAMDIAEALRTRTGIHAALFHEHLGLLERDRAAAFFADPEHGSQVLIASEIGSEGRNFQFAHHLVLFDLPLNPDLLEQRIGRLDRIGQTHTIELHVPYLENSAQAVMVHWYHEGLAAFEHTCPAGHSVFVQVEQTLVEALHQIDDGIDDLTALVETTRRLHQEMNEQLHRGRDRLLEYNSCRPHIANDLRDRTAAMDRDAHILLDYLDALFDCFGIESEQRDASSHIIRPGDHMHSGYFPGLHSDGMTITCDRATALANEDMQFITWEHPLVTGAMDMVMSSEQGNSALSALRNTGLKPGTLLLECLYILETATGSRLGSDRYLPPTSVRIVVDTNGVDYTSRLPPALITRTREPVVRDTAVKAMQSCAGELRNMLAAAERLARRQVPDMIAAAHDQAQQSLLREINRLKALRLVNPNVREAEINYLANRLQGLTRSLEAASLRLDAQRIIVIFG